MKRGRAEGQMHHIKLWRAHPKAIMPIYLTPNNISFVLTAHTETEMGAHTVSYVPLGWIIDLVHPLLLEIRPYPTTTLNTDFLVIPNIITGGGAEIYAIVRNMCNSGATIRAGTQIAQGILLSGVSVCFSEVKKYTDYIVT